MVGKITKGKGFGGTVRYIMDEDGRGGKIVRFLDADGVDLRVDEFGQTKVSANEVARSFRLQANLDQNVRKPVLHVCLSWPPEDAPRLSDDEMVSAAKEYMKRMGWEETQYFMARHMEKDNPHLHLVINMVDNKGKRLDDDLYKKRNCRVTREITDERHYTLGREKSVSTAKDIKDPREELRYLISKEIVKAASRVDDIHRLPKELSKSGISCIIKDDSNGVARGISFCTEKDGRDYKFTGSQIGRYYSAGNISKAIAMKERMPEIVNEAQWLEKRLQRDEAYWKLPPDARKSYKSMQSELRRLDQLEKSIREKDRRELMRNGIRTLGALVCGSTIVTSVMAINAAIEHSRHVQELRAIKEEREHLLRTRDWILDQYSNNREERGQSMGYGLSR